MHLAAVRKGDLRSDGWAVNRSSHLGPLGRSWNVWIDPRSDTAHKGRPTMKVHRILSALLPLVLALSAHEAAAQTERSDGPVPFVGFAVGISSLPRAFQACGDAGHATGELRGGLAWGSLALEGRGAWMTSLGMDQCLRLDATGDVSDEGYRSVIYPFSHSDAHTAVDARLRYMMPGTRISILMAGGAGWIAPQDVPYVVSSLGFRTRGRVRFALDADQSWFRLRYDLITQARGEDEPGPVLSRDPSHNWRTGLTVRLGTEISLR